MIHLTFFERFAFTRTSNQSSVKIVELLNLTPDLLHVWHHGGAQDGAADHGVRSVALGGGEVLARPHPRRRPLEHCRHGLGQERLVLRIRALVAGIDIS